MPLLEWSATFENSPLGSDPGSVLDDRIQDLKEQIRLRMEEGGHIMQETGGTNDGRHITNADATGPHVYKSDKTTEQVTYIEVSGTHTPAGASATVLTDSAAAYAVNALVGHTIYNTTDSCQGIITANDATTITCSAGLSGGTNNEWQQNDAYFIDGVAVDGDHSATTYAGGGVSTGSNPGHGHEVTFAIPLPISGTGRIQGPIFFNEGNGTITLKSARLTSWAAPTAADFTIQMVVLDDPVTDQDLTVAGTEVFGVGNEPHLDFGTSEVVSGAFSTLADDELEVGEAWVFECDVYDAAVQDVWIFLKVERV